MNTSELRAERIRQNKTVEYMAKVIQKTSDAYAKKERGVVKFSPEEIAAVSNDLALSPDKMNLIFLTQNYCSVSILTILRFAYRNCKYHTTREVKVKWEPTAQKAMTTSTFGVGKRPQSTTTS